MKKTFSICWKSCNRFRVNGCFDNVISRHIHLSSAAVVSNSNLLFSVSLCNLSKWPSSSRQNRCLSTSIGSGLFQKIHAETMPNHQDSERGFAQKIKEKYGSRLIGWDPRESGDGKPVVIYEGALKRQIRSLKVFSFTTTAMGLSMQAVLYGKLEGSSLAAIMGVFGIVGFFTFVTPILIHLVAKRYVTEMIYDPSMDTYTSVTYSFFLKRKELKFKVEDVIAPTVPGIFTTVLVNSNGKKLPLFLADVCFHDLKHFGRLMGYDKPIDFGITAKDVDSALELKHAGGKGGRT